MPRIVIVGAGPVGLFSAIQLKIQNPELSILLLEKHSEYQRHHTLSLNQASFKNIYPDPTLLQFTKEFKQTILTSELENKMLDYVKKLGIEIDYKEVIAKREEKTKPYPETMTCDELCEQYPDADIIIGADGSHSVVHKEVFNNQYQKSTSLEYIAELKYNAIGKVKPLNELKELPLALYNAKHFVTEQVGEENNSVTPVAIRIFIDELTYKKMEGATFKNPFHLSDAKKDENLDRTIRIWLLARKEMAKEIIQPDSDRLTVTHLPIYASKEMVKKHKGKTWFLVGDAAFGVPFFRSLNNGILCSSQLAKAITAILHPNKKIVAPEKFYSNYVQHLIDKEFFTAYSKTVGVDSFITSFHIAQPIYQALQAFGNKIPVIKEMRKLSMTDGGKHFKEQLYLEQKNKSIAKQGGKTLAELVKSRRSLFSPLHPVIDKDEAVDILTLGRAPSRPFVNS